MPIVYAPIEHLPVVYEDDAVLLVNKPSGMLSQPGKYEDGSALTRVISSDRELHGPILVHRLDMDTSGLLLMAKSRDVHRNLQQQFEKRQIQKRYRAVVRKAVSGIGGVIQLPIRLDVDNRPRQIVCHEHGKPSTTFWRRTHSHHAHGITLYPVTGRTHQLRVHAAALNGLGSAIVGDRLYGESEPTQRLMLHADYLSFLHPVSNQRQRVFCPAPF